MPFSETVKSNIRRKSHFQCCLCKSLCVEIHHIVPQEEGGADVESNGAPLCPSCHEIFGSNPSKRKLIKEARDVWFEICEKRFKPDADLFLEVRDMLSNIPSKEDFLNLKDEIISNILNEIANHTKTINETSQISRITDYDSFIPSLLTVLNHTIRPARHSHLHLLPALLLAISKSRANIIEITLAKDTLSDFMLCLTMVEQRYPLIFDDNAREIWPIFKESTAKIVGQFNSDIELGIITDKSKKMAIKFYNHYPSQQSSSIYHSLSRMQVGLNSIIQDIKDDCTKSNKVIEFSYMDKTGRLEDIKVIVPYHIQLNDIIRNFTIGAEIDFQYSSRPTLLCKIENADDGDGIRKVSLSLMNNFKRLGTEIPRILTGTEIKETDAMLFRLFKIETKINNLEPDELEVFTSKITIKFCTGFMSNETQGKYKV